MDSYNILDGLKNFLQLINDNWTLIIIIIALLVSIISKVKSFLSKSDEEKIEIAKKQVREYILGLITQAEIDYEAWSKAGSIKRSEVIAEVFKQFPILSKVTNQEELIAWLDQIIDEALVELRKIIEQNGGIPKDDVKDEAVESPGMTDSEFSDMMESES